MAQILIKQGTFFHNLLLQHLNHNVQTIIDIKIFAEEILYIMSQCSKKITNSSRNFIKKVKQNDFKIDQTIGVLDKITLQITGQNIKKINSITKKIQNQVIDPLQHFINSHMQQNKNVLQLSEQNLSEIQANSSFLKQLTKNFSVNKNNQQFSPNQKVQLRKIYEAQMERCNQKWQHVKGCYRRLLAEVDSSNSSRIVFTNKVQIRLAQSLNKILGSQLVQERLKQYQELNQQTQLFSLLLKQKVRQEIGKSNLFEDQTNQDFQQLTISPSSNFDILDKMQIDEFIETFTSRSNVKEQQKQFQKARILITQDNNWGSYFIIKLQKRIHTQIRLTTVKYHELTTIMKYLFANIVQNQENEATVYNLLYVCYRVCNNGNYIIQELGKYQDFWYDNKRWFDIIAYIKQIKSQTKKRISIAQSTTNNKTRKQLLSLSNLWNFNRNTDKKKITTLKQIKSQKIINQSKQYQVMCEINYFMAKLQLSEKYVFNFVIEAANKFGISRDNVEKLLKFHYFHKKISTNKSDHSTLRKKKFQIKYRNLERMTQKTAVCVGKALKYLPVGPQICNLRLVCKRWNIHLKDQIFERYLIYQKNLQFLNKCRLKLYLQISQSPYQRPVFQKMIKEMPQFTQHSDIIELDAKRSLSWDQSLRGNLIQLLKLFAFYHPNVGYLQGMNYLCQNILKLSNDKFSIYKIFQYLMTHQFDGLYTYNFDQLRIKIYSFMRILQRQFPKLYDHLQAQKLQGQHFMLSWAITLWGQMSGQLLWALWDGFMLKGWKWWIKTALWLFKLLQPQLMNMNFEQMMKCFSDLNSTLLCANKDQLKDFGINLQIVKSEIDSIMIQDQTLQDLQKQYKLKVSMIRDYIKRVKS